MKTFDQPEVYLISKPSLNWDGVEEFFKAEYGNTDCWTDDGKPAGEGNASDPELLPEFAGRMCYCSFGKKQGRKTNKEYIQNIIEMGHGSVLEHANFTFLVTRCSRGFTHEMVRHRAGFAYSQESTHYIDYCDQDQIKVLIPSSIENEAIRNAYLEAYRATTAKYGQVFSTLKALGIKKKDICSTVRPMLPIGIESKLCFTGNIRALRHFLEYRCNEHNVLEIRLVAYKVFKILDKECPTLMHGLRSTVHDDGHPIISTDFRKV
jgi:thymidylate synthase (FAD)